jgi:hypothetical protein
MLGTLLIAFAALKAFFLPSLSNPSREDSAVADLLPSRHSLTPHRPGQATRVFKTAGNKEATYR